jgi:VWA domain containing CoxE-like protein
MGGLPLSDARALGPAGRRTALQRALLAFAVLVAALAAFLAARVPEVRSQAFLPTDANGIVVLDLSASISDDTHQRIRSTLLRLAAGDGRYGLVVFSDTAYEALPPGTAASELRRVARYYGTPQGQLSERTPWSVAFTGGTRISTGLELARSIVERDRLERPALLLVSDLDDDTGDVARMRRALDELEVAGTEVRVVALNPAPEDERLFARLLGEPNKVAQATLDAPVRASAEATVPWTLLALGLALALALAAHELWRARLRWAA